MITMIVLSLIQGLTEFLPISSSGHLIILPHMFGWGPHSLEIDGVVHFGTLIAVVGYFYNDIKRMIVGFFICMLHRIRGTYTSPFLNKDTHTHFATLGLSLVMATWPVVIAGLVLKRIGIEAVRLPHVIAYASILGGMALYAVDVYTARVKPVSSHRVPTWGQAFFIGLCQCLALIPGSSRSGMCMMGARLTGMSRQDSARYAFLLSVPAILGAFTLIMVDGLRDGLQTAIMDLIGYCILSGFFGAGAIHIMMKFLKNHSFFIFMLYRVILGLYILYMY